MGEIIHGALSLICIALLSGMANAEQKIPEYHLNAAFDIPNSKVMGTARTPVQAGEKLILHKGALSILQVSLNSRQVDFSIKDGTVEIIPPESGTLEIKYEGIFRESGQSSDTNPGVTGSVIDQRGISLTGTWYPQREGLCRFSLTALLPKGYEAVSEAEKIEKTVKDGNTQFAFEFPHPAEGISLVAGSRFEVTRDSVNGIALYAYFFREDRGLAKSYLNYAKKYFGLYENLLTKYFYKRFSIVENFLSTGYSMPAFTLLGQDVVRLPFIVETSLGHEILHQWFGNSVYVDYGKGNWSEGLTTYLADQLYEEQKGKGWEYRKQMLINYESYVNERSEFPLREFRSRMDLSSRAIGYGKAAMVFHMLKGSLGEENFYRMLRNVINEKRFQEASWDDFRREAEKVSGKDLGWFFKQWLDEKGLPDLNVEDLTLRQSGDKYEVKFTVTQKGKVYALSLPMSIAFVQGGSKAEQIKIDKEKNVFTFLFDRLPEKIVLDESYDAARRLSDPEIPPVIARLIGDEKPMIVPPVAGREFYTHIIESFKAKGAMEGDAAGIKDADIKSSTLIVLGADNPIIGRLFGKVEAGGAGFSVIVKKNPWNPGKVVGIIYAKSLEEADAAFQKIFHYGKYSRLAFEQGKNVLKEIEKSERGMQMELGEEALVVEVSALKTLSGVIEQVMGKKIVYVGEYHDRFSHHGVELQVIRTFFKRNKKIAVGMEMFQRPFQKTLDDYIAGRIDEKAFLKESEYFKRWGFDYNLYKPILDFAREEKIPVVALNIRREITDKVAKEGMDSLAEEEKKEIPPRMDFSDNEYRDRLKDVFDRHEGKEGKNFDFFYQAQILWDETMAESIDQFLKKNPDHLMIVLAGGGHLAYGSGIPKRAFRRNGFDYAVILSDADIDRDIADYLAYPRPIEGVTSPKLMALLKEEKGKVVIAGLTEESVSKKAGLKEGDVLLSLDGNPVASVEDVKLALFYKKSGDMLKVKALRKRFLFGEKEMEFEVKL